MYGNGGDTSYGFHIPDISEKLFLGINMIGILRKESQQVELLGRECLLFAVDIYPSCSLKIDKTARRVFVDGEEKIFTTKEFDLLSFLAENPNKVYTKDDLFRTIWGMESVGDIATVTVHIKKIREKLGDVSGDSKYIETIWGVGYRFKL